MGNLEEYYDKDYGRRYYKLTAEAERKKRQKEKREEEELKQKGTWPHGMPWGGKK
ncbi:MAG: hypothetical protein WC819_00880 [Parcubacteria group bacterium]|jgi:hypothetical protein